jgi:hypothetical protein
MALWLGWKFVVISIGVILFFICLSVHETVNLIHVFPHIENGHQCMALILQKWYWGLILPEGLTTYLSIIVITVVIIVILVIQLLCKFCFKALVIPWFKGWSTDVMFAERKVAWTVCKFPLGVLGAECLCILECYSFVEINHKFKKCCRSSI